MGAAAANEVAPGLVACQLTLAAAAARPGETVTAMLQVSCSQPEAVELQEVQIEFVGIERVDTSWVQPSYRREHPPINTDKRKVQRHVLKSRLQAATQGTFSDLSLRRFVVRFTLPAWLPPTFRGTAVRYLYCLQAVVKYRAAGSMERSSSSGGGAGGGGGSNGDAAAPPAASVATRIPLHIWPAKLLQLEGATERGAAGGLPSAAGAAANGVPATPAAIGLPSEEMPIKCWEIGPGTAVQDAISHIVKLAVQLPNTNRPHSPGGQLTRRPGSGAHVPLAARAAGEDSRSEISFEGEEAQQPLLEGGRVSPGGGGGGAAAAAAADGGASPVPLHLRTPKKHPELAAAGQPEARQPGQEQAASSTPPSSSSSRAVARRPSLSRPSLDGGGPGPLALAPARSPALLQDNGSSLRTYALRMGDQPLVRVSLHPPLEGSLQPGSTLAGTLDFTQLPAAAPAGGDGGEGGAAAAAGEGRPSPCCVQVLILLETEEVVEAPWRRQVQSSGTGAIRRVYDEHLEVTADTSCTHFLFTIPPDAAASFQTPLVQLRWLLRFQFTASMAPAGSAAAVVGGLEFTTSASHRQLGATDVQAANDARRRQANDAVHSAVAYGFRANDRTIPYIATLYVDAPKHKAGCYRRATSHCVVDDNLKPQDVKAVYIGLVDWQTDTAQQFEYRRVVRVVRHRLYLPSTVAYDIALLVLNKPAKTKPVRMAPHNFKLNPNSDVLLSAGVARLPFVSRKDCNDIMEHQLDDYAVPATSLCAGWSTDNEDTCAGDSGGPLVKKRSSGDLLVGIVSYGPSVQTCGGEANLGVYTSVIVMRPWIDAQIKALKV
ncbi:Suppressor of tumorigenicity 14 [Chlorella vulgaris]